MSTTINEERVTAEFSRLCERCGFSRYTMNKFESYDFYIKNKDVLVSDGIIPFTDTNGKLMALKPDVTLSIIKNGSDGGRTVQKVYYNESVFRVSKRSRRFEEIMQAGLECIGAVDGYTICEVLMLACQNLAAISSEYILSISQLDIIEKAVEALKLSLQTESEVIRCIGEKNLHEMKALCLKENADAAALESLLALTSADGRPANVISLIEGLNKDGAFDREIAQLKQIAGFLDACGFGGHIEFDFSLINDMNYYNGIAFAGFVPELSGSLLSGGQYDALMGRMGRNCGAVGFALYLDMLQLLPQTEKGFDTDVVLLYEETDEPGTVLAEAEKLRSQGLRVLTQKEAPEKISYKKLMKLTDKGAEEIE